MAQEDTLNSFIKHIKDQGESLIGCEVGVGKGNTTTKILMDCANVLCMYAIDPYKPYGDLTWKELDAYEYEARQKFLLLGGRVIFIKHSSSVADEFIPDNLLDFVYIDGDPELFYGDLVDYGRKVKKGGLVSGPNWMKVWPDVMAVRALTKQTSDIVILDNDIWFWMKE